MQENIPIIFIFTWISNFQTDKFKPKESKAETVELKPVRRRGGATNSAKKENASDQDELQKVLHNGVQSDSDKSGTMAGSLPGQRIRKRLSVGEWGNLYGY